VDDDRRRSIAAAVAEAEARLEPLLAALAAAAKTGRPDLFRQEYLQCSRRLSDDPKLTDYLVGIALGEIL